MTTESKPKKLRGIKSKTSQGGTKVPGYQNPRKQQHKSVIFVENIPTTTKLAFKTTCVDNQESMRDAFIRLMRYYFHVRGILQEYPPQQVEEIRRLHSEGMSNYKIAEHFKLDQKFIYDILAGRIWKG